MDIILLANYSVLRELKATNGVVAGFSVVDQPFITKEIGPLSNEVAIKALVSNF